VNGTEDRLRRLLAQAAPDLGGIDPQTLLDRTPADGRRARVRRLSAITASVAVVALVVAGVSLLGRGGGGGRPAASAPSASAVAPDGSFPDIPASVFDAVPPARTTRLRALAGPALTADGRPEVLYVDADWCPYCAATRWALAAALSRFGTFTGLGTTTSKPDDVDPDTATIDFHGAHYTSPYLTVVFRDIQDRAGQPLDRLTAPEQSLARTLGGDALPFLDVAGKYALNSAQFDPAVLTGLTRSQIARQLTDPTSPVATAVIGAANTLTTAICAATGGQPGDVCSGGAGD
jgi:hypothetical protein